MTYLRAGYPYNNFLTMTSNTGLHIHTETKDQLIRNDHTESNTGLFVHNESEAKIAENATAESNTGLYVHTEDHLQPPATSNTGLHMHTQQVQS